MDVGWCTAPGGLTHTVSPSSKIISGAIDFSGRLDLRLERGSDNFF
jgi:hypothetical protein